MNGVSATVLHSVSYGRKTIFFSLSYSTRKSVAISVRPDLSVTVAAPQGKEIDLIKERVRKRAAWILKQRTYFESFLPVTPPRRYLSGETHQYLGKHYRLKVREKVDREEIKLKSGYINVSVRNMNDRKRIKVLLDGWFLSRARVRFQQSLEKCIGRFRRYEVPPPRIQIRKMPKRWGSYNSRGVIYLNPNLIKAPSQCIDYVVTHELCHLIYDDHSKSFVKLLSNIMPDWEQRKLRLERTINYSD